MELNEENLSIFFEWMKNPYRHNSNCIDYFEFCDEYQNIIKECNLHNDTKNAEKYTNILLEVQKSVDKVLQNHKGISS
jgi:hypothetical protein